MLRRSSKKKPSDLNLLASATVSEATAEQAEIAEAEASGKNPHAVALGRLGGKRGGAARAKMLTAERRREIARKAAETRWRKEASPS